MRSRFDNNGRRRDAFDLSGRCDVEYAVRSRGNEGLPEVIERARRAPASPPRTFVAVTEFGRVNCAVEATLTQRGEEKPRLDAVTVHLRVTTPAADRALAVGRQALTDFGGTGYVAFGAARGSVADGFESIVCFPDVVPWVAQNTLVLPRLRRLGDDVRFVELLRVLGVAHRFDERGLQARRWQLRLRPSLAVLMEAFELAVAQDFRTSLYAASLPVTRAVRIEQIRREGLTRLDLAITRGLSRKACSPADLKEIDLFMQHWIGFGGEPLTWRVRAAGVVASKKAEQQPRQPPTPAPPARPVLRVIEGGLSARA